MINLAVPNNIRKAILLAVFFAFTSGSLISCEPVETVDAQETVMQSCSQMEAVSDLDVTTQMESYDPEQSPHTVNATFKIEVSGDDYSAAMTFKDGNAVLGLIEVRRVNGLSFYREDDNPWRTDLPIEALGFPYASESLYPELGPVAQVGEETIDSVSVTHFTFSADTGPAGNVDESGDSYGAVTKDDWDVWLDSTGALVQTKRVITVQLDNDLESTTELVSKISGIGEPNVITAPDIDGQ